MFWDDSCVGDCDEEKNNIQPLNDRIVDGNDPPCNLLLLLHCRNGKMGIEKHQTDYGGLDLSE